MSIMLQVVCQREIPSERSFPLPALPGKAGLVHAKRDESLLAHLRHIHRSAVRSAEAEVRRFVAEDGNFLEDLTFGRQLHDRPLAVPRDVEVAIDIAAHAVEAVVVELLDEAFVPELATLRDVERPDVPLDALVDVER